MDTRDKLDRLWKLYDKMCCLLKNAANAGGDFIASIFTANTDSVSFTGGGTEISPLRATVKVSNGNGNSLQVLSDGAFVPFVDNSVTPQNGLVSGGFVSWTGIGLVFDISPAVYVINGVYYFTGPSTITLDAADTSHPRLDLIALDITGVIKITGTPATNPQVPSIDTLNQIALTPVLINTNATTPQVGITVVYDENTEWLGESTATANFTSTDHPIHGTKNIRVTSWSSAQYVRFTNGSTVNAGDYSNLRFNVYIPTAIPSSSNITIILMNGNTNVTNALFLTDYGFDKNAVGVNQTIVIPLSQFGYSNTNFNRIFLRRQGVGSIIDISMDYFVLQSGLSNVSNVTNITTQPVYDNIAQLRNNTGNSGTIATVLGYYNRADGGGGQFWYDVTSTQADDTGLVIKPTVIASANPGRWKRFTEDGIYNILWFGGKAADTAFDNLPILNATIAAIPNIPVVPTTGYNLKGIIKLPRSASSYYFSDRIVILDALGIIGEEGADNFHGTNFLFPSDKGGMWIRPNTTGPDVRGVHTFIARDFYMKSTIGTDITKHGLIASRPIKIYNIGVEGFSGHGITIDTTVEGIADLCRVDECVAYYNGRSGINTKGIDSNQCVFINCSSFGNMEWGVDEQSFLGNTYINIHTNVNTNIPNNPVWAFLAGVTYACIQAHTNIEPGVTVGWENYWRIVITGVISASPYFPTWSNTFAYRTGGAYNSREAANNFSTWIGCYSEGGQPPSRFGYRNVVIGGDHGAGVDVNSPFLAADDGQLVLNSGVKSRDTAVYGQFPVQETSMDRLGFSIFPIDSGTGLRGSGLSLGWIDGIKSFVASYSNNFTLGPYWITTLASDASFFNRSVAPDAMMDFFRGFMLGIVDEYPHARFLGFAAAIPTTGVYAQGDFLIKKVTGAGDGILGWRCTVSGTPGTWEVIYTKLSAGASGTFTTADAKTVTVVNGIITTIV